MSQTLLFSKSDISNITDLTKRQVQFYVDQQVVTPVDQGGLGRGKKQMFSEESLVEFGIIGELFKWGITVNVIRKIIASWREQASDTPLRKVSSILHAREEVDQDKMSAPYMHLCKLSVLLPEMRVLINDGNEPSVLDDVDIENSSSILTINLDYLYDSLVKECWLF